MFKKLLTKRICDITRLEKVLKNNPQKYALKEENEYYKNVKKIARKIIKRFNKNKMILIAGPSSSGKTTTSHILVGELENHNLSAVVISMDNFFLNREETPNLPNGMKDYESVYSVNLDLFKECMDNLLTDGYSKMPIFDFDSGIREDNAYELKIDENTIIIVEGMHAFNPVCLSEKMNKSSIKLFVCVNTDFYKKGKNIINAEMLRFSRRMIRDFYHRGASVNRTEKMWANVREGEDKYINPFAKYADYVINTVHNFEPALYQNEIEKIAEQDEDAKKYLEVLKLNCDFKKEYVAENSLIWEFLP